MGGGIGGRGGGCDAALRLLRMPRSTGAGTLASAVCEVARGGWGGCHACGCAWVLEWLLKGMERGREWGENVGVPWLA